jgi:hypothetical protein
MSQTTLGHAKIIRKRLYFVKGKGTQSFFDFSPWNGGLLRISGGVGAIVIDGKKGICGNIRTGEVYTDSRFIAD